MKIIAYTPQGKFEGKEIPYTEDKYLHIIHLMGNIGNLVCFTLETEIGDLYFPKGIIHESVFEVVK
jgi:hypothetical protein